MVKCGQMQPVLRLDANSVSVEVNIEFSHNAKLSDHITAVMSASRGPAATTTGNPETNRHTGNKQQEDVYGTSFLPINT